MILECKGCKIYKQTLFVKNPDTMKNTPEE